MFFNTKMDLYFNFGLNSPLLQIPTNFWGLFLPLRLEESKKKGEEKRRPTCIDIYMYMYRYTYVYVYLYDIYVYV